MTTFINVADLKDPRDPKRRSYREVNAEKRHAIPVGALVEVEGGARLFVVTHGRDCDQTPLYSLAIEMPEFGDDEPRARDWERSKWHHGFAEENLTVISLPRTGPTS